MNRIRESFLRSAVVQRLNEYKSRWGWNVEIGDVRVGEEKVYVTVVDPRTIGQSLSTMDDLMAGQRDLVFEWEEVNCYASFQLAAHRQLPPELAAYLFPFN